MDREVAVLLMEHRSADGPSILKILSDSRLSDFRVDRVACLSEALDRMRDRSFDVVVLDLERPGGQGLDALRGLMGEAPHVPILVLTSIQDEASGQEAVREGALAYLVKGSFPDQLLGCMLSLAAQRRRSEEALRRSERFAQAALDGLSDNIAILDEVGIILMVNRAWRDFAEANQANLAGVCEGADYLAVCDAATGTDSEGAREMAAAIRAVLAGRGESFVMEYPCHSPDQKRWFVARLNPFPGGGQPCAVIAHENISEQKRAEESLRASEARLRALYENSLVGILFTAPDGRVFNANPAACRILGRSEEEICRQGRFGVMDVGDPKLAVLLAERTRTGRAHGTLACIRGDGTRFPAEIASVIFSTAEGPRTCTIIQDVSEREAAAERVLDFSRRLLAIREEEKRGLSAALHHDVGSMSVGVGARLQAAEEDLQAGKTQEAIAALKECRRLFGEAVQHLKALAMELRPPDLDILGLPATLRQHLAQVTRITPLQIAFTDATRGVVIEPEAETTLFRVAQECLNNVIKHAGASRVRVRLAAGRRGIRLSVTDNGVGFDPDTAARRTGTGMGLQAMREMLKMHGGKLVIHSAPGKGTRIHANLPVEGSPL